MGIVHYVEPADFRDWQRAIPSGRDGGRFGKCQVGILQLCYRDCTVYTSTQMPYLQTVYVWLSGRDTEKHWVTYLRKILVIKILTYILISYKFTVLYLYVWYNPFELCFWCQLAQCLLQLHLCTVLTLNSSPYIMWVIQYGANCVKQMCPIFIF